MQGEVSTAVRWPEISGVSLCTDTVYLEDSWNQYTTVDNLYAR